MCILFSLKTIKGILLYSSFIVTYNHSDEDRRGVSHILFINSKFYHNHLYLTVDGRGLVWCVISDDQSIFYTIIQKVICSFFFLFFSVSAVVQAVNTWFFQRFVTWSQRKGVYFTWRTLAFRRVYAGRYGFHAEKVQIVAQLSFLCRIEIRALSKSTTIIDVRDFFFNDVKEFF